MLLDKWCYVILASYISNYVVVCFNYFTLILFSHIYFFFDLVAVQTSISMPPSFDFESVMQIAFEQNHSMKNLSVAKSSVMLSITSNEMIINDDKSNSQQKSDPFTNSISLSACAVDRPIPCNSNSNSLSILHKNSRHLLSRRSLFSDSSEINEEPRYIYVVFSCFFLFKIHLYNDLSMHTKSSVIKCFNVLYQLSEYRI